MRSIMIGLDGSPQSMSAIVLGLHWARRFDVLLVGLGIIDEPTICKPEPIPLGASSFKTKCLVQFVVRCTEAGVPFKLLEEVGVPSEHLLREAQRCDLIMLGQQPWGHVGTPEDSRATLTTVLKNAPRPVVTVPETLGDGTTVVVAYDGSVQAARTLQAFAASGLAGADAVHIASVGV